MGIQLLVEGSTIKKPLAMCPRRTGLHTALPHLLTQRDSGEGKDSGIFINMSAPRKVPGDRSLEHSRKPDFTATTLTTQKGKKGKAKSSTVLVHSSVQNWDSPNARMGCIFTKTVVSGGRQSHPLNRLPLSLKNPQALAKTIPPKHSRTPRQFLPALQASPNYLNFPTTHSPTKELPVASKSHHLQSIF